MSDETTTVTESEEIGNQETEANESLTIDQVKALVADAVEERDRKWQSRFDKILDEKKQTEAQKMTVEQKVDALTQQITNEKIATARERILHEVDIKSDLVDASRKILSSDPSEIAEGAKGLKEFFDTTIEAQAKALYDKMVAEKFGNGNTPPAGQKPTGPLSMSEAMELYREDPDGFKAVKDTIVPKK